MARSQDDIFKRFNKDEVFVIGTTPEERVELLYIRQGMAAGAIQKRLEKWGDEITLTKVRKIIENKDLKQRRKDFRNAYDSKKYMERAEKAAVKDVSDEDAVRSVYAEVSGQIINSIKQKMALACTPDSPIPQLNVQDLASLSMSLEVTQKVHHKALGIPELIKIDPTSGLEGIRLVPKHEIPAVDDGEND